MKGFLVFLTVMALFVSAVRAEEKGARSGNALGDVVGLFTAPMEDIVSPIMELGRIVVTATKTKEALGAQSSATTVIGEKELNRRKHRSVKEALKSEMGIGWPTQSISSVGADHGPAIRHLLRHISQTLGHIHSIIGHVGTEFLPGLNLKCENNMISVHR